MHCLSLTRKHEISLQRLSIFFKNKHNVTFANMSCLNSHWSCIKHTLCMQTRLQHFNTPHGDPCLLTPSVPSPPQFINSDNNNNNKKEESNMETRYLPINTSSSWKGKEGKNIQGLSLSSQKSPFFTSLSMSGRRKEKNWTQWVVRRRRGEKEKKKSCLFPSPYCGLLFFPLIQNWGLLFCLFAYENSVRSRSVALSCTRRNCSRLPSPPPLWFPPLLLFPPTALLLLL